jgi:glucosylceramidase
VDSTNTTNPRELCSSPSFSALWPFPSSPRNGNTRRAIWNLILDQENGPRHAGGTSARGSTIVNADTTTGKITYNPPHYVLGQFSRFIRPGAKRIACTSSSDDFIATAALNPDGTVAVVVCNLTARDTFLRVWRRGQFVKYQCPPNGTITFVFQPI